MGEKAEYRSAIRSRENILRAFAELLSEKGSVKIKINELVKRADVNRSTFYAHYRNIYDVLNEIENEIIGKLFSFLDSFSHVDLLYNPIPFILKIGAELEKNRTFYRLLIETEGSINFLNRLKDIFIQKILADKKAYSKIKKPKEFIVCMNLLAGGAAGLICDWTTGKIDMPMRDIANIINDISMTSMKKYL